MGNMCLILFPIIFLPSKHLKQKISEMTEGVLYLSNVQNPVDIPLNPGCLIRILIMVYYNRYMSGSIIPIYPKQLGYFFIAPT